MALTLSDAIANAVLFAGDAKTDSGGLVKVGFTGSTIHLDSYDDYLYIEQKVTFDSPLGEERFGYVDKKVLKDAGPEGILDLEFVDSGADNETFETLHCLLWQFPEALLSKFVFPSDRFGKLSRLKGEDPTVVTLGDDSGMQLAKFKKGDVIGLMSFLEETE